MVRTQTAASREAAPRGHGAVHLRPPARLPDLRGERRLRAAGHGRRGRACATSATAMPGTTTSTPRRTSRIPYFTFDGSKCIVCSRCVRACEESAGDLRPDDRRAAASPPRSPPARAAFLGLRVRLLRRVRAGVPDGDARGEVGDRARRAAPHRAHDLRLLRRRLLVQGRAPRRRGRPDGALQGRRRQRGPLLREGPFRLGLRDAQGARADADGPRDHRRRVAGGLLGRGHLLHGDRRFRGSRLATASARSAGSPPRAAPTKRSSSSRRWSGPPSATTTSTPARGSATPRPAYGLKQTFGTSAGTQDFRSVDSADVILVIGANPTEAHPVFASRMKRRLRDRARSSS